MSLMPTSNLSEIGAFMGLGPSPSPSGDRLMFPDCSPTPFDGTAEKVPTMVWLLGAPKPRHLWVVF